MDLGLKFLGSEKSSFAIDKRLDWTGASVAVLLDFGILLRRFSLLLGIQGVSENFGIDRWSGDNTCLNTAELDFR